MATVNISDIQSQLLLQVKKVCSSGGQISLPDDLLSALHFVFQGPFLPALDIIDHDGVSKVTCPSGRTVFQVVGSSGKLYTCFSSSNYCSCLSFTFSVLKRKDIAMCKHVLAVYLSSAMGKNEDTSITDQEMTQLITSCSTPKPSE
ncbi:zinc finger SWIM domain-containing protein 7-like [Glandiceps talaboti]